MPKKAKRTKTQKSKKGTKSSKASVQQKQKQSVNIKIDLSKKTVGGRRRGFQQTNRPPASVPMVINLGERNGANQYMMNMLNIQNEQIRKLNSNINAYRQRLQSGVGVMNPRAPVSGLQSSVGLKPQPPPELSSYPPSGPPQAEGRIAEPGEISNLSQMTIATGGGGEEENIVDVGKATTAPGMNTKADYIRRILDSGKSNVGESELSEMTHKELTSYAKELGIVTTRKSKKEEYKTEGAQEYAKTVESQRKIEEKMKMDIRPPSKPPAEDDDEDIQPIYPPEKGTSRKIKLLKKLMKTNNPPDITDMKPGEINEAFGFE